MDKKDFGKPIHFIKKYLNTPKKSNKSFVRKSFHFDLNTKLMEKYYTGGNNYRKGYRDIEKFLSTKGFEHEQGSGYTSKEPMTESEAFIIATQLKVEFPWLEKCVKKFTVTDFNENRDITEFMTSSKPNITLTKHKSVEKNTSKAFTISRKQMNDIAKKCSESSHEKARSKQRQKNEPTK